MEMLTSEGAGYRTVCMTQEHAEQFAACLRGNEQFAAVEVCESSRAKGEKRWYVIYEPASAEAREALLQRQAGKRAAQAKAEVSEYLIVPDESGSFYWLQSASGEVYEVTVHDCTCPDAEYRCRANGLRCKHSLALETAQQCGSIHSC